MAIPASLAALSTTAASNPPNGSENPFPELDDHLRFIYSCTAQLRDNKADTSSLSAYLNNTVNAWKTDSTGLARLYFEGSSGGLGGTYVRGYGNYPFWVQNAAGTSIFTVTSDGRLNCIADATNSSDVPRKGQMDTAVNAVREISYSALSFSGLSLSASGTSSAVSVSAAEILVRGSDLSPKLVTGLSLSINTAASGANGLDSGSLLANTWYAVWVIYNPSTTTSAGLISTASSSPTLPAGYTHKARVGWIRTDGTANKYPLSFKQYGKDAFYVVASGSNVTAVPEMASATSVSFWTAVPIDQFAPSTAGKINVCLTCSNVAFSGAVALASNNSGSTSTPHDSPLWFGNGNSDGVSFSISKDILIESSNIYWGSSTGTAAPAKVKCFGWTDNL